MLNTKDVTGYMVPLAPHVTRLHAVTIPGEKNTLPAEATRDAALSAGIPATIDNDIAGTDYCLGVDTALNMIRQSVDSIREATLTASPHTS